ncbi:MAG: hypothetical protein IJX95_04305 [Lachnospiraceae bacterium]|nr:hypothetical protein [Lachnospiraceae bacterium]
MKKKSLLIFVIVAMFAFAGCAGEKGKTVGTTTGTPSETRGVSDEKGTPEVTMSPEQKELAEHLRIAHEDEVSARLVEQGYYHIVNETREDEIFRFDFKALTGDEENLMMVFDVTVEDEILTEMYPVIRLGVDCEREENYEPGNWWNCDGYGVQDPENKKLYHVIMSGYIFGYAPTVAEICQVAFDVDTDSMNGELVYEVNPEPYYVDVPLDTFVPVLRGSYSGMGFSCGGRSYEMTGAIYGSYYVDFEIRTAIDAAEVPTDDWGLEEYREELQKEWTEAWPDLTLVADGKEYKVVDEDGKRGYLWFNVEEGKTSYQGYVHAYFPAVDYFKVSELELKVGDTIYNLK